jgi:hypothetical protein
MTKLAKMELWMDHTVSLMRTGLLSGVAVTDYKGLFAVVGTYSNGTQTAPLAKYSSLQRADDVVNLMTRNAKAVAEPEQN